MTKRSIARPLMVALALFSLVSMLFNAVRADEGMWTFANPPLKQLQEKYNFSPSQQWLDHARLASARLNNGGSGSFVSADGLVLTNHHIAKPLLAKLSTSARDLVKNGFYAPTRADELRCPDLEINVLVSLEDVTAKVQAAAQGAADNKTAAERRKAVIAQIEKESSEQTKLRSNVITLYEGGEYWLYRFKKYTDIRMVFAPEAQAADFGGDYDNFSYPRYVLDFAFLRVYENDQPAKIEHYFRWSSTGAADNELIFVIGNPGTTDRLRTYAELEYQRDFSNPRQLRTLNRRRKLLLDYAGQGSEQARRSADILASINNSLKRLTGQQEGLQNAKLMQQKKAEEDALRARIASNPDWQKQYGNAWQELAEVYHKFAPISARVSYSSLAGSRLAGIANVIVEYVAEVQKPNGERLEQFRDSNLESLKFQLFSPAPIYLDLEERQLADRLQEIRDELGADDPFVKAALGNREPTTVAHELIAGTKLQDVEFRKSLIAGGAAAVANSNDPMIVLARQLDPITRELDRITREEFDSARTAAGEKVAQARFTAYGRNLAPDANFTLRFSYGLVKGYELNTTLVPYKTTFAGLYDRAESFDNRPPFELAPKVRERKSNVNQTTPLNFVYTADTIGGNSGSPVINRNGEVVGVNFDSNVHRFVSRYIYTEETGRAMAIHSAGMLEALRKIYDAGPLADELEGKK